MKENEMMDRKDKLLEFFKTKAASLWNKNDKLFLACSGGMDSVVLGHLLISSGYTFEILHANFQLREEESERDELFVRSLANHWQMNIQVRRFDTIAAMNETGTGVQEAARNLRYEWFDQVLDAVPSSKKWLLTAHHADDQVETVAMNFFRGTGIAGLRGMKEKNERLVRPLLAVFHDQMEAYAETNELKWVEDSSNRSTHYTRNLFRLEILPLIEKVFPAVRHNIFENAVRMAEVEQVYIGEMEKIRKKLMVQQGENIAIPVNLLEKQAPLDAIMHHLFSPFGFSAAQIPELKKLFSASSGKFISSATHRVLRNRNWLLIDPVQSKQSSMIIIENQASIIEFPHGRILMDDHIGAPDNDPLNAYVDKSLISYPLILRPWKPGDYFYPLGMRKKKKLSRFMTDAKLSRSEKEKHWVLESNKKIVWVIGRRIDDRFKIISSDKPSIKLSFSPHT